MSTSDDQFRIEEIAGSLLKTKGSESNNELKMRAAQIVHQGLGERFGEEYNENFNHDLKDLDGNYLLFCGIFNNNNEMVGTGGLSLEVFTPSLVEDVNEITLSGNEYCLRVERVSIDKEYRRKGLALQMMNYLISRASQLCDTLSENGKNMKRWLVVETDTPWIDAVQLYKKLGFIVVCERDGCTHFKKEII